MGIGRFVSGIKMMMFLAALLGVLVYNQSAFAQETSSNFNDFTKFEGDEIQTNPTAQKILDRIEESKRILSDMLEAKSIKTEHQKFIDEQRKIVQQSLQAELERMNKKYEENSPRNAFSRFVANFNATHHGIYWDQFEYMESKVNLARAAKQQILDNGGSFKEAQSEYIKYASMPRGEIIQKIIELNIKYGFANSQTQENFDEEGKLPRYENDDQSKCYGCDDFVKFRDNMFDLDNNPYNGTAPVNESSSTSFVSLEDSSKPPIPDTTLEINPQLRISELEQEIQILGKQVDEEDDFEKQRILLESISKLAGEIELLQSQI